MARIRINKKGHMWMKSPGPGHYCYICGCTREIKTVYHYPEDKYTRGRMSVYILNGEEYRESPPCKNK